MNAIDYIIIGFIAFIGISLIYNRIVKIKKAKAKGLSSSCCGCMYSSQCSKAQASTGTGCASKDVSPCCSSNL